MSLNLVYRGPKSYATLSEDGAYRYSLMRAWGWGRRAVFIMLNPSTADAEKDDPTIRRCVGFAKSWGLDALLVLNLFALRATDPKELLRSQDPIGPDNVAAFSNSLHAGNGDVVIAAWGSNRAAHARAPEVRRWLEFVGIPLHYLRLTKDGEPAHPLYLPASLKPKLLGTPPPETKP